MIEYKRAYYFSEQEGGGGYFPLDAKLGIDRRHTPGCQYFLSSFTGREAYQKSLERLPQKEIKEVFEGKQAMAKENSIKDVTVVSVDATKLRQKGQQQLRADGRKSWPTVWRDVKVGAVSSIGWDEKRQEAVYNASCYDSGIEHADLFFKRSTVEVLRRAEDLKKLHVVSWPMERTGFGIGSPRSPPRKAPSFWTSIMPASMCRTCARDCTAKRPPCIGRVSIAGKLYCSQEKSGSSCKNCSRFATRVSTGHTGTSSRGRSTTSRTTSRG